MAEETGTILFYMQNSLNRFLLLFTVIFSVTSASGQSKGNLNVDDKDILKQFNYQDSITFKTVNGEKLDMIVFLPAKKKYAKTPVMLFTHGGGWSGGNRYVILKKNFVTPLKTLLDNGIACVSIEYRLSKGNSDIRDAVADCKDAGKYLVKHADDFGFDTNRMGVWGGSAGGHLSLMTGLADDIRFNGLPELENIHPSYKCIVSYYPQTTFTEPDILKSTRYFTTDKLKKMFGERFDANSDDARSLSPAEYIKKGNPPVLLLHGTADSTLSFKNSTYFIAKAKKAGTEADLVTVNNGGHGFSGKSVTPSLVEYSKIASDFMLDKLLNK